MRASLHASLVVQVSVYTIARVLLQRGLLALPRASCLYAHSRGTHSRGTQWPLPRMSPTQESGRSLGASAAEPRRRGSCRLASARAQRRQDLRRRRTLPHATQRRGSQGQPLAALGGVGLVGRRIDGGGQQRVARVEAQRRAPALRRLLDLTGGAGWRGASAGMHLWCGPAMAAQTRLPAALGPNVPAWPRTNKREPFDPAPLCALRARPLHCAPTCTAACSLACAAHACARLVLPARRQQVDAASKLRVRTWRGFAGAGRAGGSAGVQRASRPRPRRSSVQCKPRRGAATRLHSSSQASSSCEAAGLWRVEILVPPPSPHHGLRAAHPVGRRRLGIAEPQLAQVLALLRVADTSSTASPA